MLRRHRFSAAAILACAAALVLAGCAGSSGSGGKKRRQTILLTEYDDARVGREAASQVAAEVGLVEDPELTAYVDRIGQKLLRGVARRSFQYQFSVVDQFEPNAFALPGGYIFLSRGLLALANNEDEVANVIGHEITHAALRHAAAQQALAKSGNPLAMPWVRAAHLASYGRDMEREADRGGQMLAAAAGYDPMGMSTFLKNLGLLERFVIGYARLPTFFDTHPGSQERAAINAARAREIRWKRDPALGDTRAAHLRRVDGLALGDRPETGIFVGERFLHPDLDFQIRFPEGWRTSNTNRAVGAVSPRGDAVVFLTADQPSGDPKEVAEAFVAKIQEEGRVAVRQSQPVKIGRLDAWRMELSGSDGRVSVVATMTFIPYRGATWRITGASPASTAQQYLGRTLNTARSFRPLTPEERSSIRTTVLRLATPRHGEDLTALGARTDNAWEPARTAVFNGIFSNERFQGDELVKIARIEPYAPSPP
ncbi:MAG: M48 family metalloprotease [Deltaproteobacteria bacterium]|nr:MAG: M48 family metalloprotease [Deltaproteobacteria bacterium]